MSLTKREGQHLDQLKAAAKAMGVFADLDTCDAMDFAVEAIEELDGARDTIDDLKSQLEELKAQAVP